jgi:hypothetical protein
VRYSHLWCSPNFCGWEAAISYYTKNDNTWPTSTYLTHKVGAWTIQHSALFISC